jgi:hypothetical protein
MGSILDVKSTGLGGVVHEIKKHSKVKVPKVSKYIKKAEKKLDERAYEKYKEQEKAHKLYVKGRVNQSKAIDKDFTNRKKALVKIHSGKGFKITKANEQPKAPISYKAMKFEKAQMKREGVDYNKMNAKMQNQHIKAAKKYRYDKWGDRIW